jgi:Bacterial aa3 type cytochrome c oxidase subunit IV
MADHATVQYATAAGNDLPAHEATYESFVHFATIGTIHVICIVLGLAVGGVMGRWMLALPVFLIAIIGAIPALVTNSRTPSYISFAICFLIFVFASTLGAPH